MWLLHSCLTQSGGETAEMPDMYPPGEYDLAGFAVGAMERDEKLPHLEQIVEEDTIVGIASSGLHSNGFSLVRKIVAQSSLEYSSPAPAGCGDQTLGKLRFKLSCFDLFGGLDSRKLKLKCSELHHSLVCYLDTF